MNKIKILKVLGYIIICTLSIIVISNIDFYELKDNFSQMPFKILGAMLLAQTVRQFLLIYQQVRLARAMGDKMPIWKMLYISSMAVIFEGIIPGAKIGGESIKMVELQRKSTLNIPQSLALVCIQKVISISIFFMLIMISIIYLMVGGEINRDLVALVLVILALIVGTAILFVFTFRIDKIIEIYHYTFGRIDGKIVEYLQAYGNAIKEIKSGRLELIKLVMLSLGAWILYPTQLYILITMFDIELSITWIIAVTFIAYIAAFIPLLPGGLLSFELAMTSMLVSAGLEVTNVVFITSVFRFTSFWAVFIVSGMIICIIKLINAYTKHNIWEFDAEEKLKKQKNKVY